MEKATSREDVSRAKDKKNFAPPIGFYNPRFKQVERKTLTLFDYELETPKPRGCFTTRNTESDRPMTEYMTTAGTKMGHTLETLGDSVVPEKARKKISVVDFNKTLPRKEFYNSENLHEERFNYVEYPPNFTKTKRIPSVSLTKSLGRNTGNKFLKSQEYAPDYNPNYEYGRRKLPVVPGFDKLTPRKPVSFNSCTITDKFYDSSPLPSHVTSPRFQKSSPREMFPRSPLPSFMQKPVTSRTGIEQLSQKTLEINAYGVQHFKEDYSPLKLTPRNGITA